MKQKVNVFCCLFSLNNVVFCFKINKHVFVFDFVCFLDEPLSCFSYRAWGEGQPTKSYGCVSLTRPNPTSFPFWQNVPCKKQLRYICEMAFDYRRSNSTDNEVLPNCDSQTTSQSLGMIFVRNQKPSSSNQGRQNTKQ